MKDSQAVIQKLELLPHPEGGYFRETYRSEGSISQSELGNAFDGDRNYSTCIYFLLEANDFSAFHRIKQDEIWHFYHGEFNSGEVTSLKIRAYASKFVGTGFIDNLVLKKK